MLSNVDHMTAQDELDQALLPHYLLSRQLAMEQVLRAIIADLPAKKRAALHELLSDEADAAMLRIRDEHPNADPKRHASDCGYVCAMLLAGM